jgi:hypothetical protein
MDLFHQVPSPTLVDDLQLIWVHKKDLIILYVVPKAGIAYCVTSNAINYFYMRKPLWGQSPSSSHLTLTGVTPRCWVVGHAWTTHQRPRNRLFWLFDTKNCNQTNCLYKMREFNFFFLGGPFQRFLLQISQFKFRNKSSSLRGKTWKLKRYLDSILIYARERQAYFDISIACLLPHLYWETDGKEGSSSMEIMPRTIRNLFHFISFLHFISLPILKKNILGYNIV